MRSIVAGGVDLLSKPLTVAGTAVPSITLTLGVSSPPPWVKVSGHVVGLRSTGATPNISLTAVNTLTQNIETHVNPDGSFEFPMLPVDTRLCDLRSSVVTKTPFSLPG